MPWTARKTEYAVCDPGIHLSQEWLAIQSRLHAQIGAPNVLITPLLRQVAATLHH